MQNCYKNLELLRQESLKILLKWFFSSLAQGKPSLVIRVIAVLISLDLIMDYLSLTDKIDENIHIN